MKSFIKCFLVAASLILLASGQVLAQEWSAMQKEVWKNVETYWGLEVKGDLEGLLSYFHEDYSGWFNRSALPGNKAATRDFFTHALETEKILLQDIQPVAIKIHGNIAIVHYYFSRLVKDVEGKERNRNGRWTDILLKQGDKWVLIADHGGPSSGN